jgi:hypothetical protein
MVPQKSIYISIQDCDSRESDLKKFMFIFIELPNYEAPAYEEDADERCELLKYANNRTTIKTNNKAIKKAYRTLEISNWSEKEFLNMKLSSTKLFSIMRHGKIKCDTKEI